VPVGEVTTQLDVRPTDRLTFALVAFATLAVAVAARLIPALRAAAVDLVGAFRAETSPASKLRPTQAPNRPRRKALCPESERVETEPGVVGQAVVGLERNLHPLAYIQPLIP
jgi:hypothetical protein